MNGPAPSGYLSPAVRALSRLHALEPARMTGTGANGRFTLADALTTIAPAKAAVSVAPSPPRDGLLEIRVDVTGDDRPAADVTTAVRAALLTVSGGETTSISWADVVDARRVVPPLPDGGRPAVGIGAPFWTPVAALTSDGQRVITARMHRTVTIRFAAGDGGPDAAALLSAVAAALTRPTD